MKFSPLVFFLGLILFCSDLKAAKKAVVLSDSLEELWVVREYVDFFVDTSLVLTVEEIDTIYQSGNRFIGSTAADLINEDIKSAYWLRFQIIDTHKSSKNYNIEIFDHDIDEITLYTPNSDGSFTKHHSGAATKFDSRQLGHKNVGFIIPEIPEENNIFYMRFYSTKLNVLEPGIRSLETAFNYSIKEYLSIGLFYGVLLLIILYNLVYYVILRHTYYLFYLFYIISTLLYLAQKDGTGFQFLWPNYPEVSNYISVVCLAIGTIAMYLFCVQFLSIKKEVNLYRFLINAIVLRVFIFVFQVFIYNSTLLLLVDFIYAQFIYAVGWYYWRKKKLPAAKWFVLSYSFFNFSVIISLLERLYVLPSGISTVYAVNIGLIVQFVLLTIGIAETVKEVFVEKIKTDEKLIEEYQRNEALKTKVNRELEEKVSERTSQLNTAKEAIEVQSQEIKLINRDLDIANFQLRKNLTSFVKESVSKSLLSFNDFQQAYPDDFACKRMLLDLKNKKGFTCKQCGNQKSIKGKAEHDLRCSKCNYNESLTANTIFHRSRFPLLKGFYMLYSLIQSRNEMTAVELNKTLDLNITTCQKFKTKVQERKSQKEYNNKPWEEYILNRLD